MLLSLGTPWLSTARAANQVPTDGTTEQLPELSLEQLMSVQVTSVEKQAQPLAHAAAAVFVITNEDIRRSGVTTIPEALRMAPGLQVARIDSHRWALTSRGFNGEFGNKLLVLMDGRTIYTPLFSGVFWDAQDTVLEDIDRIEVIRGPGAALWGANAVNGVINIITKQAKDTQGLLASAGAGTEERGFATLRYGGSLGSDTHFRLYAKHFERDDLLRANGTNASDSWRQTRAGFRADSSLSAQDNLTVQGDYYNGKTGIEISEPLLTPPFTRQALGSTQLSGAHALARWTHTFSDSSTLIVQSYIDHTRRENIAFTEHRTTYDLDLQHSFRMGSRHQFLWGVGYRYTEDRIASSPTIIINPGQRGVNLFSGFAQDSITLVPDRLTFIAGSKIEHNDYTGWVVQPSGRLRWTPTDSLTFWGAVSKGFRTPSRIEDDGRVNSQSIPPNGVFPGSPVGLAALIGNRDFGNESMNAFELGGRAQLNDRLSIDIAGFYNHYDRLRTLERGTPTLELTPLPPHLLVPLHVRNLGHAETRGVEISLDWRPLDWWRLQPSYTYLHMRLSDSPSIDTTLQQIPGENPQHQVSMRSLMHLPGNMEFDLWGRYVSALSSMGVPSYVNLDSRIAWTPMPQLELALIGQNLLDSQRAEFKASLVPQAQAEVQRGVFLKATWRY
ncbi:MAG: TonB-dependent receptor [Nitrospiraceae bacterium]